MYGVDYLLLSKPFQMTASLLKCTMVDTEMKNHAPSLLISYGHGHPNCMNIFKS